MNKRTAKKVGKNFSKYSINQKIKMVQYEGRKNKRLIKKLDVELQA